MRTTIKRNLLLVGLILLSTVGYSQENTGKAYLGISTGFVIPLGTRAQDLKSGNNGSLAALGGGFIPLEVMFRYDVSNHVFINLLYMYNIGLYRSVSVVGSTGELKVKTNMNRVMVGVGYSFHKDNTSTFRPFIGLDLGLGIFEFEGKTQSNSLTISNTSDVSTGFALTPKVGFDVKLSENFLFITKLSYTFIGGMTVSSNGTTSGSVDPSSLLGLQVGVAYRLPKGIVKLL